MQFGQFSVETMAFPGSGVENAEGLQLTVAAVSEGEVVVE